MGLVFINTKSYTLAIDLGSLGTWPAGLPSLSAKSKNNNSLKYTMYLIFFGTWPYLAMCPKIVKSIPNPIHWATDFEKPSLFLGGLISSKTKTKRKKNKTFGTAPD